jgi:ribosomal protein S18 acetylase RimI-like enzyme
MMDYKSISLEQSETQTIIRLYSEVWGGNPEDFSGQFNRHMTYPGFHGIVAYDGKEVIGFAYGYTSIPGQFYHELLRKELAKSHQEWWLEDCFEFVELVVHPSHRRKKLGQNLVEKLLENTQNQTSILTTQRNNTSALSLYDKLNWETLEQNFKPGENTEPYVIMGKKQKL